MSQKKTQMIPTISCNEGSLAVTENPKAKDTIFN